jgi:hypothetical protein
MSNQTPEAVGDAFTELRREVSNREFLSSACAKLLLQTHSTGRLTRVGQNRPILKSGYQPGFTRRKEERMVP